MIVYSFFMVFLFNINFLYYSNIIYYVLFVKGIIKSRGRIRLIDNKEAKLFLSLFAVWTTISTYLYAIYLNKFDFRTVIQFLFTLQYIILIISLQIDYNKLKNWIYRFSIIMSIIIILVALSEMFRLNQYSLSILFNNERAYRIFPGWPNSIPIPLLLSLLVSLRNNKPKYLSLILVLGLVLTTSRGAYLGVLVILIYYFYSIIKNKKIAIVLFLIIATFTFVIFSHWLDNNPYEASRLSRSSDRMDITKIAIEYISYNPIVGYGGNTIEQLTHVKINYKTKLTISHTHNWVLEIIVRYGIVGFIFFSGMLISLYKSIKDKDCKFLFLLYVFLALFQTFMRDFVFIFILAALASNKLNILNKQSED